MLKVNLEKNLAHYKLDVSFQLEDELVILFGKSGSGKTTLLNMLAGLIKPEQGKIQLGNRMLFETGKVDLPPQQRNVGYVFQDYALFPHMTVEKNIYYGIKSKQLSHTGDHVKRMIDIVDISHLLSNYPGEISGGEKQRVALVRALAYRPDLLLMDEPFSALDEKNRLQCHEEILRLKQEWQIPILLVTHDHGEASKLGDRIVHMEEGKVTQQT
ncbi:ATP-binding cassette domain-containing protein [Thalassobacillus devorans]|uniref:ATP-binding cassette domain-containing protein n=1 Tax=Thalassobacillus devorans TaxID=279813 RepID=UPI00048B65E4|nr:ATP-binding cassette domain-containing protein [Thalassobacillus devorans]